MRSLLSLLIAMFAAFPASAQVLGIGPTRSPLAEAFERPTYPLSNYDLQVIAKYFSPSLAWTRRGYSNTKLLALISETHPSKRITLYQEAADIILRSDSEAKEIDRQLYVRAFFDVAVRALLKAGVLRLTTVNGVAVALSPDLAQAVAGTFGPKAREIVAEYESQLRPALLEMIDSLIMYTSKVSEWDVAGLEFDRTSLIREAQNTAIVARFTAMKIMSRLDLKFRPGAAVCATMLL
ncbi:MAG: hypothetical protein ABL958_16130 [Bdellovibrionia bacterium]